jgi:hypothetical protein
MHALYVTTICRSGIITPAALEIIPFKVNVNSFKNNLIMNPVSNIADAYFTKAINTNQLQR